MVRYLTYLFSAMLTDDIVEDNIEIFGSELFQSSSWNNITVAQLSGSKFMEKCLAINSSQGESTISCFSMIF